VPKLSRGQRIVLAAAGIVALVLLVVARNLEPDPRGYGTHQQLGFTPCYFHEWTGHPCPTCGMTTAWSHALRGNIAPALEANLGGVLLAACTAIGVPWLLISAAVGRWMVVGPSPKTGLVVATAWLAIVLVDWLQRWFTS